MRCRSRGVAIVEKVLVTGQAGKISSHMVLDMQGAGYFFVGMSNFHNAICGRGSMLEILYWVQELTGCSLKFVEMDILDQAAL